MQKLEEKLRLQEDLDILFEEMNISFNSYFNDYLM